MTMVLLAAGVATGLVIIAEPQMMRLAQPSAVARVISQAAHMPQFLAASITAQAHSAWQPGGAQKQSTPARLSGPTAPMPILHQQQITSSPSAPPTAC